MPISACYIIKYNITATKDYSVISLFIRPFNHIGLHDQLMRQKDRSTECKRVEKWVDLAVYLSVM